MMNEATRVNERIRISPVMVVRDGVNLGTMSTAEAMRIAREEGLDLVEIAPNARPPVCRIMDYGKFKYEKNIKEKQQRKNAKSSQPKEVRLRPVTQDHDLDTKTRAIRGFLEDGHSVQVKIKFQAREITHKELGFGVVNGILDKLAGVGQFRERPSLMGKWLTCVIEPAKPK